MKKFIDHYKKSQELSKYLGRAGSIYVDRVDVIPLNTEGLTSDDMLRLYISKSLYMWQAFKAFDCGYRECAVNLGTIEKNHAVRLHVEKYLPNAREGSRYRSKWTRTFVFHYEAGWAAANIQSKTKRTDSVYTAGFLPAAATVLGMSNASLGYILDCLIEKSEEIHYDKDT